jgi:hypothetical protein
MNNWLPHATEAVFKEKREAWDPMLEPTISSLYQVSFPPQLQWKGVGWECLSYWLGTFVYCLLIIEQPLGKRRVRGKGGNVRDLT